MWFYLWMFLALRKNNMIDHSEFPLLKLMLRVFYLFKVQYQFENGWVTGVWIKCDTFNKTVTFK